MKPLLFLVLTITAIPLHAQTQDAILQQIRADFATINLAKSEDRTMVFERLYSYPFPEKLLLIKAVNVPYMDEMDLTSCWTGMSDSEQDDFLQLYFGEDGKLILLERKQSEHLPGDGGGEERKIVYYFKDDQLIFCYEEIISFSGFIMVSIDPVEKNKLEMASRKENRFYFHEGKLIHQLRKHVPVRYEEEELVENGNLMEYLSAKSANTPSQEVKSAPNQPIQELVALFKEIQTEWGYEVEVQVGSWGVGKE